MAPARILRKVFKISHKHELWYGQNLERFLIIDGERAKSYFIPDTECSYGFIIQSSGKRTILLRPSEECYGICRSVSVVLKPSQICKHFSYIKLLVILLHKMMFNRALFICSILQLVVLEAC